MAAPEISPVWASANNIEKKAHAGKGHLCITRANPVLPPSLLLRGGGCLDRTVLRLVPFPTCFHPPLEGMFYRRLAGTQERVHSTSMGRDAGDRGFKVSSRPPLSSLLLFWHKFIHAAALYGLLTPRVRLKVGVRRVLPWTIIITPCFVLEL